MRVWRVSACICIAALATLAGCDSAAPATLTTVAACQTLGNDVSRMEPHLPDTILLPEDIDSRNGLALTRDAIVTFDQAEGRVTAIGRAGEVRWTYGRTGDGPGEIAREFSTRIFSMPGTQWVATDDGYIVVFDGRTFLSLSDDGALARSWSADAVNAGRAGSSRRLRIRGERAYIDMLGMATQARAPGNSAVPRMGEVFSSDSAATRLVAALELPALPVNEAGTISDGLAQAKPRWDLQQSCLVLSDGHSSRFVFVNVESGESDTVDVGLPEWYIDVPKAIEATSGLTRGAMPEPTARARVGELTLAGDGVLWVRPAAQAARLEGGQVVWRYTIRTGVLTQDTVVVFPRYADRAGGVYGTIVDSSERTTLVRVRIPGNVRR